MPKVQRKDCPVQLLVQRFHFRAWSVRRFGRRETGGISVSAVGLDCGRTVLLTSLLLWQDVFPSGRSKVSTFGFGYNIDAWLKELVPAEFA